MNSQSSFQLSGDDMTRDELDELIRKAETGEQWAEICRIEAKMKECDCCGHVKTNVIKCVAYGIDTMACDDCRE